MSRARLTLILCAAAAVCGLAGPGAARVRAQGTQGPVKDGPQTPAKAPDVVRIPMGNAAPDRPPIPITEIIRRFATQEDDLARRAQNYTYRRTVRVQEFGPDGKPSGQSEIVTEQTATADGRRTTRPAGEQQSTLRVLHLEIDALQALTQIPMFPMVSSQVPKYQFAYQGTQAVDELTTYVFRVRPLAMERERAHFDGLIWVDNHDLAIVKTYGKWVTDLGAQSPSDLPFTIYETYRQPVENKYWMPGFTQSDAAAKTKTGSIPVRLVIRWDNYTPVAASKPAPPAATPAGAPGAEPPR